MNAILYYSFSYIVWLSLISHYIYAIFQNKNKKKNGVALLPYYPVEWPGGNRTAAFKEFFLKDGIRCEIFAPWEAKHIDDFLNSKRKYLKYKIYYKLLFNRLKTLRNISRYDSVWVQRAFIPMFPFKHAYFEKLAKRFNDNIIYDYYDADYESNYNLVYETVKHANKVSVASLFLKEKFLPYNKNTHFIRFSVNHNNYISKKEYNNKSVIKIGWMGSPANALQLLKIKNQLQQIDKEYSNVLFSFVCRDLPNLSLRKMESFKWGDKDFDYYNWLADIDIGIVPFIDQTDRVKAKISMKSLEFMVAGVPQVCSEYVFSDKLINNKNVIVTTENKWFDGLSKLIKNEKLRYEIGSSAKDEYHKVHAYDKVYWLLKEVLLCK